MSRFGFAAAVLLGTALALASPALAAAQQPRVQAPGKLVEPAKPAERNSALGDLGGNSREPIKIDADRLDVFDRESRAVFAGNVVAVQGETTMRCTTLTVHYENRQPGVPRSAGAAGDNAIRQIECKGPVTVASKEQIVTGDNATFDRVANKVLITGNVALSQCKNVTRGERVVYDLNSGVANVETAPGKRVQALFVPGGGDNQPKSGCQSSPPPAAAQAAQPVPAKPAPRQRAQN